MAEEKQNSSPIDDKLTIPFGATLKTINLILKGLYIAGADKNFLTKEMIRKNTGVKAAENNLPFLIFLKAIERNDKDSKLYRLTEVGARYAKAANANDNAEMAKEMKNLLDVSYSEIVNFITLRKSAGNLDFDTLFNHLKAEARIKEDTKGSRGVNPAYAVGIFALIDMMILAGYADESIKPNELLQQHRKTTNVARPKSSKVVSSNEGYVKTPSFKPNEGMQPITWGDSIAIYLKKGDRATREKIAKLAKQFIDIYVEEGEDVTN